MKKRLIALLLVGCMALGLAACGKEEKEISYEVSDEPVTITYYYDNGAGGVQQYTEQVEQRLNEILQGIEGYEHITIELYPSGSHQRDLTLAQASGDPVDLVSTWGLDLNQMIKNGDFIELDSLMKQFPDAVADIPEWIVDYGKVFDHQYFIPTYQQVSNLGFFVVPEDYLNMYMKSTGKTMEDVSKLVTKGTLDDKLDFLEELCLAVREGTGSKNKWIFPEYNWNTGSNTLSMGYFNQEYLGNQQFSPWVMREGEDGPEYWGYTEEFKKIMERYAEWYQKGLLHPDCTSIDSQKFTGTNFLNDSSYVNIFVQDTCSEEYLSEYYTDEYGLSTVAIRNTDHAYVPSEWEAGGHAIGADCEHPAEAMMIIELLRSEKGEEFYNTLVYGLEGIHWEWADQENDEITTLEFDGKQGGSATCTYSNYKWSQGNVFHAWKNQSYREGFNEYVIENVEKSEDTVFSPAMGIAWDFSDVKNQFIQVTAVENEYKRTIYTADDWEKRYDEYIEKLEAAGLQDVLDELDRQYQEVLKSK